MTRNYIKLLIIVGFNFPRLFFAYEDRANITDLFVLFVLFICILEITSSSRKGSTLSRFTDRP